MTDCSESDRIVDALDAKRSISAAKAGEGRVGQGSTVSRPPLHSLLKSCKATILRGQSEA